MKNLVAPTPRHTASGFTLIELMIVVAIVAIITAVALPSYKNSVDKARRAEARGQLLEAAQFMQRFYSQNDSYMTDKAGAAVVIPTALVAVPRTASTTTANYTIAFTATPTIATFTLTAVARAGGLMAADKCGNFLIDNVGRRSVTGSLTVDTCWK